MAQPTIYLAIVVLSAWIGSTHGAIPTGCVRISSYYNNMYLNPVDSRYNEDRQHVETIRGPKSLTMVKEEDYYRFLKPGTTQELYAGEPTFDAERRYVFLWTGPDTISESKWIIQETFRGRYLIRSRHLDELMYASFVGKVYTWRTSINPYEDEQFHWRIEAC